MSVHTATASTRALLRADQARLLRGRRWAEIHPATPATTMVGPGQEAG